MSDKFLSIHIQDVQYNCTQYVQLVGDACMQMTNMESMKKHDSSEFTKVVIVAPAPRVVPQQDEILP